MVINMNINIIVGERLNEVVEKIMESKTYTDEQEKYNLKRTNEHIGRVQVNLKRLFEYDSELDSQIIQKKIKEHDQSKFSPEEYVGYIHTTEKFRPGSNFKPTPEIQKLIDDAWAHHKKVNAHHPEYHSNIEDMSREDIAEMVADWAAMSQEKGGSLIEWAENAMKTRFKFTEEQEKLIIEYAKVFKEVA